MGRFTKLRLVPNNQRNRNMPSKTTTIKPAEVSRMTYRRAKKYFDKLPQNRRPSTVAGRKTLSSVPRIFSGVCHDWNKGKNKSTGVDNVLEQAVVCSGFDLQAIKDRIVSTARALLAEHVMYVSTMAHPLNPTISGDVHVITFPCGTKKIPDLHRLEFGTLMRILRERENKSCRTFGKETGLSVANIWNLENEKTSPRLDSIAKYVGGLHLSDDEFKLVCLRIGQLENFNRLERNAAKKKQMAGAAESVKKGWKKRDKPAYSLEDVRAIMEEGKLEMAERSDAPATGKDVKVKTNPIDRSHHGQ